ncbi:MULTISPECIES: class I SAM-dependent methyltransferase [Kitasatospora]|uniref:SAM-dependent methyltransferase n=2 Tax=Kitasatospora TaxID=2063 RepID=A0ABT1JAD2_9ACTN|nr:class I SAM-dependent methyltransferase [Kitasatospora paracochleata]MCP2314415.1 SAM-dependent methyltransferase [Kitasatospora paracochleata]
MRAEASPTRSLHHWHLRSLRLGRVLDVGCGVGRNLRDLPPGSVGVDRDAAAVAVGRSRGLDCFTDREFLAASAFGPGTFDSLLCAHVLEHLPGRVADDLLDTFLPYVRPGGRVVLICPQEAGFATDATQVRPVDFAGLREHAGRLGLAVHRQYSFPLVRRAGRFFPYNESVLVGSRPLEASAPGSAVRGQR